MKMNANQLRPGNILEHEDKLYTVLKIDLIQPGKGNAVAQLELRDVRSGNKTNMRFRTQESIERVRVDEIDHQYLFNDGDSYTFMNTTTYEQIPLSKDIIGEQVQFLQDGMAVQISMYEGEALSVALPDTVTVTVLEAEPVVKGQTASSSYKPAMVDNDVRVMVPPHIETGTRIVVKTEDGSYVERAKD